MSSLWRANIFLKPFGRECSRCNYKMIIKPHNGTGGRGTQCPNCSKFTVRNGKCTSCGAVFEIQKQKK